MEAEGSLHLQIITPERKLVDRQVKFVSAPGSGGEFGVLPGHTEFFTSLGSGEISYEDDSGTHFLAVAWGYAEVKPESVVILAENAELAEEVDKERAIKDRDEWERKLQDLAPGDEDYDLYKGKHDRAAARISVTSRLLDK